MKDKSSTQLKKEIYLRDVARRWKSELNTDKKVYILSPYITSKAEDVLENAKDCEIYTDFSIENFAFGSSSLSTIKNLINKGFKVYSIQNIHAKIVLVTDTFVSIGSQNLTNQGTQNKEATFTSDDLEVVQFIESELKENWFNHLKEITLEVVEILEKELKPLIVKRKKLNNEVEKVKESFEKKEKEQETEKQRSLNYLGLRHNIGRIKRDGFGIQGKIKDKEQKYFTQDSYYSKLSYVQTFEADSRDKNLLMWRVRNDSPILLEKTFRYLAVIEDIGKLGWARIMEKSITYVGQEFSVDEAISIELPNFFNIKVPLKLGIKANWDISTLRDYNLEIFLSDRTTEIFETNFCHIRVFFDLNLINIFSMEFSRDIIGLEDWVSKNKPTFIKILKEKIFQSFKYRDKKLEGPQVNKFLYPWSKCKLTVGKVKDNPLLVFSEIPK